MTARSTGAAGASSTGTGTGWSDAELLPLVVAELRTLRSRPGAFPGAGEIPVLHRAAEVWGSRQGSAPGAAAASAEAMLRGAVGDLAGARTRSAAAYTFGLVPGTRYWSPADRRRRAAAELECGPERYRKYHETLVVERTAEAVVALGVVLPAPRVVPAPFAHGLTPVTVHTGPIELLRGIDVLVSSENTYFEMAPPFRASTSAALRRAGALRDAAGAVVDDVVARELRDWAARHAASGRSVTPGTVAATSPGRLAQRGVRRLYHAAVAEPRAEGGYRVSAAVVTASVHRVFAQARRERDSFTPPAASLCFPLLGAGRGGLALQVSARSLVAGLAGALGQDPGWTVHVVALEPAAAAVVEAELLSAGG